MKPTIEIRSNGALALQEAYVEAEDLSAKGTLSKSEERRYSWLLAKISMLKSGFSPKEIANIDAERIARSANLVCLPKPIPSDAQREWRAWLDNKNCRHFERPVKFEIQEIRAQEAGQQSITNSSGAAGGFFVPVGYADRNLSALKAFDELFENCNEIETMTGAPMTVPSLDDTSSASQLIGENVSPGPGQNFTAQVTQLSAYSFRSGMVFVTLELLADSGVDVSSLLETAFAVRHARGAGQYMVSGAGPSAPTPQPTGLITAGLQTGNVVVASGSSANDGGTETGANSIGTEDLNALWGALNRSYRRESVWAVNDETLIALNGLLDKIGRPLVRYNNDLATIYNRPVIVCPSMEQIGPSNITVALYAPRFYVQRRVPSGSYLRKTIETPGAIEKGAVAFQSYFRCDSNLCVPNPAVPPIALLQQHS
jgi:HK97 family phage major capsid protein